jgi:phosphatidylserine decarboxylase
MYYYLGLIASPLLFLKFFFRKPERKNITDKIVSPCDGVVTKVDGKDISIFLSLLDVHWQYVPINSKIKSIETIHGANNMAILPKSSHNAGVKVVFDTEYGDLSITQRVGFFVRRIQNNIKIGDIVKQSNPYGIIRFGSRVDIVLPENTECILKKGQRVVGGETILIK